MKNTHPFLQLTNIVVAKERKIILNVDSFSLDFDEKISIIGGNGAGKSTLMMVMSQLLQPTKGELLIEGKKCQTEKERLNFRRKIALVMQDALLLDASVFDNTAAGLYFRGYTPKQVSSLVEAWLDKLGILALRNRHAYTLSGGEARRVSLARAFVLQPKLLFLDEPFNGLDAQTRLQLIEELLAITNETKTTTVIISHDINEAMAFGEKIVVMMNGKIRQIGSPQDVLNNPKDSEVASFIGTETVVPAQVLDERDGLLICQSEGITIEAVGKMPVGRKVFLCLRAEDVTLSKIRAFQPSSARNHINGQIVHILAQGPVMRVRVDCGFIISALITRTSVSEMGLNIGDTVNASFKASAVHVLPR